MTTYTIRALAWDGPMPNRKHDSYEAVTAVGKYVVWWNSGWRWKLIGDGRCWEDEWSIEKAMDAAEAHYRERIEQALEVVG